jgi:hypothetical protein
MDFFGILTNKGKQVNFIPNNAVAVTPSDSTVLNEGLLFIGTGGDVKVRPTGGDGSFVTFKNVPNASFLPIYVDMVHSDTSAADILICY